MKTKQNFNIKIGCDDASCSPLSGAQTWKHRNVEGNTEIQQTERETYCPKLLNFVKTSRLTCCAADRTRESGEFIEKKNRSTPATIRVSKTKNHSRQESRVLALMKAISLNDCP